MIIITIITIKTRSSKGPEYNRNIEQAASIHRICLTKDVVIYKSQSY